MFPLAHAWLIHRLVPAPTSAHFLGCVWPDMLFASPLSHTESHRSGARLADAANTLPDGPARDEFRAFVAGALSHGTDPHGFDWYSDEEYGGLPASARGYAFQQAVALAEDAARACDVPEHQGWWKAHNLVEMAFEQSLYLAAPHLGASLAAACADEALCNRVAGVLAGDIRAASRRTGHGDAALPLGGDVRARDGTPTGRNLRPSDAPQARREQSRCCRAGVAHSARAGDHRADPRRLSGQLCGGRRADGGRGHCQAAVRKAGSQGRW